MNSDGLDGEKSIYGPSSERYRRSVFVAQTCKKLRMAPKYTASLIDFRREISRAMHVLKTTKKYPPMLSEGLTRIDEFLKSRGFKV